MNKIYEIFLEGGIINKEEYDNINKEEIMLNAQSDLFNSNLNDFIEFANEILENRIEAENNVLKEIQQVLESNVFRRYYRKYNQDTIGNLQSLLNNSVFIGEGIKDLEKIKQDLNSAVENQLEAENKFINNLMKDIKDYNEDEKEMIRHYLMEDEFRNIISEKLL